MAFERPCLVFADPDGNMYDEPDLHMLCMDASGLSLPRPEEVTPLPAQCELVLLPGRFALGLEPETGEVAVHEGLAVAALVPSNYLAVGLPAAQSDTLPPPLPSQAYAAVGFANNRFYMAAKKIDEAPHSPQPKQVTKKTIKASNSISAKYPDNRFIRHLVSSCAQQKNCWAAQNFCLGKSEFLVPIIPFSPCNAQKNAYTHEEQPSRFLPSSQELLEAMLHHARSVKKPVISWGHPCNLGNSAENLDAFTEAISLFRQYDTATPIALCLYDHVLFSGVRPHVEPGHNALPSGSCLTSKSTFLATPAEDLPLLVQAGISHISYTLSCPHSRLATQSRTSESETQTAETLHSILESAVSLGLNRTIQYEYFAGLSDTGKEVAKLVKLLQDYSIHNLRLTNYACDPHQVAGDYEQIAFNEEFGPVMGIGNFLKHIKRECPHCQIMSGCPF